MSRPAADTLGLLAGRRSFIWTEEILAKGAVHHKGWRTSRTAGALMAGMSHE
jgi:hypothetical protein